MDSRQGMLQTVDMGNNMEHCSILIYQCEIYVWVSLLANFFRLDGATADNPVDERTLKELNELGDKPVRQGRSSHKEESSYVLSRSKHCIWVYEQKTKNNGSWQMLQSESRAYK